MQVQELSLMNIRRGQRLWLGALALGLAAAVVAVPAPARAQGLPDFTELVEKVGPAVVNIRTTERARVARNGAGPEIDEDMLEFFRRFGLPVPNQPNPRTPRQAPEGEPQQRGVGSGFVLNADGYVSTTWALVIT